MNKLANVDEARFVGGVTLRVQIEAFYVLLNVLPRMEVKAEVVRQGIIPLLVQLLVGENGAIVRQASQTLTSLCEVSEYRCMAIDNKVFDSLTTGMRQIFDNDARVAMAEAIGSPLDHAVSL